jgi:hypothetical protein
LEIADWMSGSKSQGRAGWSGPSQRSTSKAGIVLVAAVNGIDRALPIVHSQRSGTNLNRDVFLLGSNADRPDMQYDRDEDDRRGQKQ